jgi:charged multivesicular body protein 7
LFERSGPAWNDLRVTYSPNPFSKVGFNQVPRTENDAQSHNWQMIADYCNIAKGSQFLGKAYWQNNDPAVVLLFDKNGIIAGIQTKAPKNKMSPTPSAYQQNILRDDGAYYTETAYFVEPSTICTTGRTQDQLNTEGTGTGVWIQNGPNPTTNFMQFPNEQSQVNGNDWKGKKCLWGMGVHFWYKWATDLDCSQALPIFPLYNKGKLNAFGFTPNFESSSSRYETPSISTLGFTMSVVPNCLKNGYFPHLKSIHIYFTSDPRLNLC